MSEFRLVAYRLRAHRHRHRRSCRRLRAGADQPNMQAALGSLQPARAYLVQSTPNKGGHARDAHLVSAQPTEAGIYA